MVYSKSSLILYDLLDCVLTLALHFLKTEGCEAFWQLISNVQWNQLFSMLKGSLCAIFGCCCNLRGVLLNNSQIKEDFTTVSIWL